MQLPLHVVETRFFNYKGRRYVKDSIFDNEIEADERADELETRGFLTIVTFSLCGTYYSPRGSCYVVNKIMSRGIR